MNDKYKLILASKSPRRKDLLGYLNLPFEVITRDTIEESDSHDPDTYCKDIALNKGREVYMELLNANSSPYPFVISSDTIVVKNKDIYGKPRNNEEARRMLLNLSDGSHIVITAFSFLYYNFKLKKNIEKSVSVSTKVTFCQIDPCLLDDYIKSEDSLDKAGAYGIQGPAEAFISKIEGSYSNVVGLPISDVARELISCLKTMYGENFYWKNAF